MLKAILASMFSITASFVVILAAVAALGWLSKKYSAPKKPNGAKRYKRLVLFRKKGWVLIEGLSKYDNTGWTIKGTYITDSGEQVCLILEREIEEDNEDKNE